MLAVHSSDFGIAHHVCFPETGVIGGVSVLSDDSQSSAARMGGEVSLSFSRFCSFFGSLSRTQCDPASHSPPRPRLFTLLAKTKSDECTFGMAVEERHKSPSPLGMAGEERHKSLLSLVLYVCVIGSAILALPMTPLLGISREFLTLVEAYGAEFELLRLHSWSFNTSRVFWQCTPQTLA